MVQSRINERPQALIVHTYDKTWDMILFMLMDDNFFLFQVQLHKTTESFEKLERTLKKKEDESKAREDEMRALLSKVKYHLEINLPKAIFKIDFSRNWSIHGQM